LIAEVRRHPEGISPKDLKQNLPAVAGKVDVYLQRAAEAGRIRKLTRGLYAPVSSVSSVSFDPESDDSHTPNTSLLEIA